MEITVNGRDADADDDSFGRVIKALPLKPKLGPGAWRRMRQVAKEQQVACQLTLL
jgi:hypothetical protein